MKGMPEISSERRSVAEQTLAVGIDAAPDRQPGVPMEVEPSPAEGVHWRAPERQQKRGAHLHRRGIRDLTPVYGNAVPPRGVSGLMRRVAYRIPEHRARHWALLLAADRVDVLEARLGRQLSRPMQDTALAPIGRQLEKNPVGALAVGLGAGLLLWRIVR